jgi:uncharacterized tellurite resistance protein B-like protein
MDHYIRENEKNVLPKIASLLGIKMSLKNLILSRKYKTANLPLDI